MPLASNLQLIDEWKFIPNKDAKKFSNKELKEIKSFFRKYLIMILLIWDNHCSDEASFRDYLEGDIDLHQFIENLDFYDEYSEEFVSINTVKELENFCRSAQLINFYGN